MGSYKNRIDAERGGRPVKAANRRARQASIKKQNQEFEAWRADRMASPGFCSRQTRVLDYRLGQGEGAKKERAKLAGLAAAAAARAIKHKHKKEEAIVATVA